MHERETLARTLAELPSGHPGDLARGQRLAQARGETPTTAHALAALVFSERFAEVGEIHGWPLERLQQDAARLLGDPTGCRELQQLQISEARVLTVLWETDPAAKLLHKHLGADPTPVITALRGATAVMWHQHRQGWLRPLYADSWKKLAADTTAYDEQDIQELLSFLHAQSADFGRPGSDRDPPGWRSSLERMVAALPSYEGLRAWAGTLSSPWKEGLLEGLARLDKHKLGLDELVGEGEPDWKGLAQLVRSRFATEAQVGDALLKRGWYRCQHRWPPYEFEVRIPRGWPSAKPPPTEAELARVPELVAALPEPVPAESEVQGPPDYVAVAKLARRWGEITLLHEQFEVELPDLLPGRSVELARGGGYPDVWLEAEHHGGRTLVWVFGGDGEHGPEPALLARSMLELLERWAAGELDFHDDLRRRTYQAPDVDDVLASTLDARGDEGLAGWLAELPPFTRVRDLRDVELPAKVYPYEQHEACETETRCGEVVIRRVLSEADLAMLDLLRRARTPEEAASLGKLHPLSLAQHVERLREHLGVQPLWSR